MAGSSSPPDYKALFLRSEEARAQADAARIQADEARIQADEARTRAEQQRDQQAEQLRPTTFAELLRHCHHLLSQPLRVGLPRRSTKGTLPPPTGKCCPLKLRPWTDCAARQLALYRSVCRYLEPPGQSPSQLFSSVHALENLGQRIRDRPITSEQDLAHYERLGVEDHVHDIIKELSKIQAARDEFGLCDGVWFENHGNVLDEAEVESEGPVTPWSSRPDQFCIHRVDGDTGSLLATVEYKPPHKLSVENLRVGLRHLDALDFWDELVGSDTVPVAEPEKLKYNAARLAGSALVQEYHVMIQEGLEYSYVSTGLALVLLRVPLDDPSTLYYHLCEPNEDVNHQADQAILQPTTAIARVLCLCLMSFHSPLRDQKWRNHAQTQLPVWKTSFDHTRSQIPKPERQQKPPDSDYVSPEDTSSEYMPSSPIGSPAEQGRRIPTRSQSGCAPSDSHQSRGDSPDSDPDLASPEGRKRGFSQVTSSSPITQSTRPVKHAASGHHRQHTAQFCTQRCLLGVQNAGELDYLCPNVKLHQLGGNGRQHPVNADSLVQQLKQQLDDDLDYNCTPFDICGSYGAPFKITSTTHGYTMVGKGTTSRLWPEVSREAQIYQVLKKAQCSAISVFLGAIDLDKTYFLHGAGEIRHMLLMAWAGQSICETQIDEKLEREISKSCAEIRSLGVTHGDLREENILWNAELQRALIIDFHRCHLDHRPIDKRLKSLKRASPKTSRRSETRELKRPRMTER
ncbi:hypothetical protein BO70DRAFT_295025 [Aspergillus heteromorphus CBS 117.55]|uniref:Protein kinase domain-containing protein n=1 Tax=Aspergillus heteromorphus CBS 117.55 TaxID=1448321 RepID=A0A317VRX5_9EURO|nr:uncharacterized protein BO70DRAFT_295025 [Aspergillus heteromorphus CBS 117.55]PWY77073.1 hypothetical protein BO70DRAFT_295025 [Aspergillus heteromorphus CBS 117.55]